MAEDQAEEKTEEPSGKRLSEAREKGQVARSRDLNATVILMFTAVGFLTFGKELTGHLATMMRQSFEFDTETLITPLASMHHLLFLIRYGFVALVPILVIIFLLSLAAPLIMGGWVFSRQALRPNLSRFNLIKGIARMFSLKSLVEVVKSLLKFSLVSGVSIFVLKAQIPILLSLGNASLDAALSTGGYIIIKSFVLIASSLLVIAFIDVPFQLYQHKKSLKMTKQELKEEHKNAEGSPEAKGALRRAQREMARRRMMAEVPQADVVVTNPTHYAVALSYKQQGNRAPIVVAKGKDLIAFQITKIAKENQVPIISVPPLARAVYFSTKLNKEIPRGLYVAVAQVLAYIFQLNNKQKYDYKPAILQNLPIPPDLARHAVEEEE